MVWGKTFQGLGEIMPKFYSITDFIFNRKKAPIPFSEGPFRTVPGRPWPEETNAAPVKVVNVDEYGMTQSSFTLAALATEYTIQGIATLSAIIIKARGGSIQLSIYEGQSNLNYMLIEDKQTLELSVIPFAQIGKPINLYMRTLTAGTVAEILGLRTI
jgi:hypothetical protein